MTGGDAGVIVFSHANGFPAGTYRLIFEAWRAAGYRVEALDKFGHHTDWPVSSNWPRLRDQLLHFIEERNHGEPAHLVGHSLGGFVSLLAACKRPALARSVVLLDSPIVAGWRAHGVRMAKVMGLVQRAGPGRISARRRWQWPSADAALAHFASKPGFARWQPEVLRDYIASGVEADDLPDAIPDAIPDALPGLLPGVRLAFSRDIETRIYNTLPHNLGALLRRHPPGCPVTYIGGTQSAEGRQAGLAATRALVGARLDWIEGGHLFPMEQPAATAQAVLRRIAHNG